MKLSICCEKEFTEPLTLSKDTLIYSFHISSLKTGL